MDILFFKTRKSQMVFPGRMNGLSESQILNSSIPDRDRCKLMKHKINFMHKLCIVHKCGGSLEYNGYAEISIIYAR